MLGLAASLQRGGASLLTYVKDNLKLYLDFKKSRSDTLAFPSEGSTEFDGDNDYIDFGNISLTDDFTVSAWVKCDDAPANWLDANNGNVVVGDSDNNDWIRIDTATLLKIKIAGATAVSITHGLTFTQDEWQHITVTRSSNTITVYRNGIAGGTTGTLSGTFTPEYIGQKNPSGGSDYFDGKMANNAIWSRVLSLEEINSVMNKSYSQLGSVEKTSLVMWQSLDSVSGVAVIPASGETLGSEMVGSGFYTLSNWTTTNTEYSNPTATSVKFVRGNDNAGGYIRLQSASNQLTTNLTIDTIYKITLTFTTDDADAHPVIKDNGNNYYSFGATSGEKVLYYKAVHATNDRIMFQGVSANTFVQIADVSIKEVTSDNIGLVTGATTTTSVYGGNAPILPRAIDIAESFAEQIGNGSALFNGSSDFVEASSLGITGSNSFSISAWIYPHVDPPDTGNDYMLFTRTGSESSNQMACGAILRISGANYLGYLGYSADFYTNHVVPNNEWSHVVITYSGGTYANGLKLYLNGIVNSSLTAKYGSTGATPNVGNTPFQIGKQQNVSSSYWDGNISQVGVWRGALTQAQVQAHMEAPSYAKIPSSVKSTLGSEKVANATDWTDSNSDGLADNWSEQYSGKLDFSIVTGNGFTGNAQRFDVNGVSGSDRAIRTSATVFTSGTLYKVSFKYRASISSGSILVMDGGSGATVTNITTHTGDAKLFETYYVAPTGSHLWFYMQNADANAFMEIDEVSIKEVTNDLVAYYPLDADSSRGNGTDDVSNSYNICKSKCLRTS